MARDVTRCQEYDMTQSTLAKALGCSSAAIGNIVKGSLKKVGDGVSGEERVRVKNKMGRALSKKFLELYGVDVF